MLGNHEHEAQCVNCGTDMICYDCWNRSVDQICAECEEELLNETPGTDN